MAVFEFKTDEMERLFNTARNFPNIAEKAINDVFHNEAPPLVSEEIKRLIPVSGKNWKGKEPAARTARSPVAERKDEEKNLTFVVGTTNKYHYLYFPDDGTNTRRHVGNQQFFKKGGETKQNEIIDLCTTRMLQGFENE